MRITRIQKLIVTKSVKEWRNSFYYVSVTVACASLGVRARLPPPFTCVTLDSGSVYWKRTNDYAVKANLNRYELFNIPCLSLLLFLFLLHLHRYLLPHSLPATMAYVFEENNSSVDNLILLEWREYLKPDHPFDCSILLPQLLEPLQQSWSSAYSTYLS